MSQRNNNTFFSMKFEDVIKNPYLLNELRKYIKAGGHKSFLI